ncbi:MAG: cytochrome c [Betaproteobacteria bacterium]|jgi:cytochrome c553|nr:cytochrome c [Betaproteobacteria bacterium]
MTHHRRILRAAVVMAAAFAALPAIAGNIAAGKEKATALCAACHGADGVAAIDPSYPKLAGQYPDYLARALSDYKSGARKNAIMAGMAAALSKEDIANISAFYASLPSPLNNKK